MAARRRCLCRAGTQAARSRAGKLIAAARMCVVGRCPYLAFLLQAIQLAALLSRANLSACPACSGLLSKASMRLRQAMQREGSAQLLPQAQLELSGHSGSSSTGSERSTAQQQGPGAGPAAMLLQRDSSGSQSGEACGCCLWDSEGEGPQQQPAAGVAAGANGLLRRLATLEPSPHLLGSCRLPIQARLQAVQQPAPQEPLGVAQQGAAAAAGAVAAAALAARRGRRQRGGQPAQQRRAGRRRQVRANAQGQVWRPSSCSQQRPPCPTPNACPTRPLLPAGPAPACRRTCCPAWGRPRPWAAGPPPRWCPSPWSPPWIQTTALVRGAGVWL